jgi:hypothetical protein
MSPPSWMEEPSSSWAVIEPARIPARSAGEPCSTVWTSAPLVHGQVRAAQRAVDRQRRDAEVRALDAAVALELRQDLLGGVDGHGEADADVPAARAARLDLRVHADDAAGGVDERPARVARVDRRVRLDDVGDREAVGRPDLPLQRGHDAGGQRPVQAEGVADRDDGVAHLDVLGGAERQRAQVQPVGVDLQSARSDEVSLPITFAPTTFLSASWTVTLTAPSMTWAFVRMLPLRSMTKPGARGLAALLGLAEVERRRPPRPAPRRRG